MQANLDLSYTHTPFFQQTQLHKITLCKISCLLTENAFHSYIDKNENRLHTGHTFFPHKKYLSQLMLIK